MVTRYGTGTNHLYDLSRYRYELPVGYDLSTGSNYRYDLSTGTTSVPVPNILSLFSQVLDMKLISQILYLSLEDVTIFESGLTFYLNPLYIQ